MTIAFSPVSTGGAGLLYEFTRLYSIHSGSFLVPKVSLHLHLLTGGHFSATQAGGASVRAPVPLSEQHKHPVHLLSLPHSALLESSRGCSMAFYRAPQSLAFEERHIFLVLPFGHDEEVSYVLSC